MIVAIHQPNFFPWMGYFNKIARADVFCLMDNAQFPKTGGTWVNRVRLLIGGEAQWCTAPVTRGYSGVRAIREMELNNATPWREKLIGTIRANYGRAPAFAEVFPVIEPLIRNETASLADYNVQAIRTIAAKLGLTRARLVLGSELQGLTGQATDLLIQMTRAVGGTAYLCGGGAGGYQEDEKFAAAGIGLVYQNFAHPVYTQAKAPEFVPGLSIIDVLMHCGFETAGRLVAGN